MLQFIYDTYVLGVCIGWIYRERSGLSCTRAAMAEKGKTQGGHKKQATSVGC